MEPAPENVNLVDTPADDTLFEGQTWGRDGIDCCAVAAQNQNEDPSKMDGSPKAFPISTYLYTVSLSNGSELFFYHQHPGLLRRQIFLPLH